MVPLTMESLRTGPKGSEPKCLLPKEQGSHLQLTSDTGLTAQNQDPGWMGGGGRGGENHKT